MMHPPGGFCQHQFAAGYQHEARGADAAITEAIGTHVESEQGKRDDEGGASGDVARPGSTSERVTGIEPALSAWEADVLPLNYTRAVPSLL